VTGGTTDPRGCNPAPGGEAYSAGTPAPASGTYETVNLFGRRTGHRVAVAQGELLPALPRGFNWALAED
jgi:hypothetical protein